MFSRVHRKRMTLIGIFSLLALAITGLVLFALKNNINLFYTPTELIKTAIPEDSLIRVGGMVTQGSLQYLKTEDKKKIHVQFKIHDTQEAIMVDYNGVLPDLFREGQGVVVQGYWRSPRMKAVQVLAKHDENYVPPRVMQAMKESR